MKINSNISLEDTIQLINDKDTPPSITDNLLKELYNSIISLLPATIEQLYGEKGADIRPIIGTLLKHNRIKDVVYTTNGCNSPKSILVPGDWYSLSYGAPKRERTIYL